MELLICTQAVDKHHPILGFFHRWILELSKHFAVVHVICLEEGEHDLPEHVHIYSLGKETGKGKFVQLYRFYKYFGHIFFRVRVRYVFFHMGAIYNVLAAPFFWLRRFYHTDFYWWKTHGQINVMGRLALLFVDRVYTAVAESFPVRSQKRRVVGHAIDTDLFVPAGGQSLTTDILFVGRFSRSKKLEQVVSVVEELTTRGHRVSAKLVGAPVDPDYLAEIKAQIAAAGLGAQITIAPPVDQTELVALYQSSRVFLNPSEHDGLDKVILEAMACGCIPLTGNRSFAAILEPQRLFMQKGDIIGFADRIEALLEQNPTERAAMSEALRAIVTKEHTIASLPHRLFSV